MKCAICISGKTAKGFSTVLLEKDETILVFKQVPSEICENCGEEYIETENAI
jgi:YgiT-type zinc finger domain-containing protein